MALVPVRYKGMEWGSLMESIFKGTRTGTKWVLNSENVSVYLHRALQNGHIRL